MDLDINAFIEDVAQTRDKLEVIVEDIYKGREGVFEKLQEMGFSSRNQELFLINANLLKGKRRRSGRHYMTHPGSAAYILQKILPDDYEHKEKAIAYTLTHDLVDEALEYDDKEFRNLRELNSHYRDEFDMAVLLAIPDTEDRSLFSVIFDHTLARTISVYQVKQNQAVAIALLADKLDNMLDFDEIRDGKGYIRDRDIFAKSIGYAMFAAGQLKEQVHPNMFEITTEAAWALLEKYGLPVGEAYNKTEKYQILFETRESDMKRISQKHQKRFLGKI